MNRIKSIRGFVGAKDFQLSRDFYVALGFNESIIDPKMSLFTLQENISFYLQDYYIKDWVNNSMLFLELTDLETFISGLAIDEIRQFAGVRISKIKQEDWGKVVYLHDPSGVLWHFAEFKASS